MLAACFFVGVLSHFSKKIAMGKKKYRLLVVPHGVPRVHVFADYSVVLKASRALLGGTAIAWTTFGRRPSTLTRHSCCSWWAFEWFFTPVLSRKTDASSRYICCVLTINVFRLGIAERFRFLRVHSHSLLEATIAPETSSDRLAGLFDRGVTPK
jgi:hypothetical protein